MVSAPVSRATWILNGVDNGLVVQKGLGVRREGRGRSTMSVVDGACRATSSAVEGVATCAVEGVTTCAVEEVATSVEGVATCAVEGVAASAAGETNGGT